MTHKICNGEESKCRCIFLLPWTNVGTSRVMKVAVKFHRNCVCSFGEKKHIHILGGNLHTILKPHTQFRWNLTTTFITLDVPRFVHGIKKKTSIGIYFLLRYIFCGLSMPTSGSLVILFSHNQVSAQVYFPDVYYYFHQLRWVDGGYAFSPVCLSVSSISQNFMDRFGRNLLDRLGV